MSGRLDCDLIASTGVHSAEGAIKQILAGASAVQIASALYKNGIPYLAKIIDDLKIWMDTKGYKEIDDFKGKLSQDQSVDPAFYSRVQFMKYFRGFEG